MLLTAFGALLVLGVGFWFRTLWVFFIAGWDAGGEFWSFAIIK